MKKVGSASEHPKLLYKFIKSRLSVQEWLSRYMGLEKRAVEAEKKICKALNVVTKWNHC